jgi:pimeloyl-ACP methyl ester carboxylesterase
MAYATNNGVRIHYEVEGEGPPLVLHHGSFGSGSDWRDFGYANVLKRTNQLILIDARGHGASDKPHNSSAYDMASRAADVTSVLDALEIQRADFFGYSMGGWIGFGLAKFAPERVHSLILGGAHPFAENIQGFRDMLQSGMAGFISTLKQVYGSYMTPVMLERHQVNDLQSLLALSHDRADFSEVLPTMTMPCLLFVGEDDPRLVEMRECAAIIRDATFFSLPGCGHVAALCRSDLVLPHVTAFLTKTR